MSTDQEIIASLMAENDAVEAAIGSVRFMDPPDGGDVSLGEQVARMRQALEAAEAQAARLERELAEARKAAVDMLEALRRAERGFLADARQKSIVGDDCIYHLDGQAVGAALEAVRTAIAKAAARPLTLSTPGGSDADR